MQLAPDEFLETAAPLLAGYYAAACALDVGAAWHSLARQRFRWAGVWAVVAGGMGWLAWQAASGRPLGLPETVKQTIDAALGPVSMTLGSLAALVIFWLARRWFVRPGVGWTALNAAILLFGGSLADPEFAAVATAPDSVPIVAMVFLLGWFTWANTAAAVENDRRRAAGRPLVEQEYREKVLVWPDVVYLELIGLVVATTVLVVWSLAVRAPLGAPANPAVTPNPSKAPWYFVGLQEMLVYFDPWMAGVVIPGLIILGLMAIPYLDRNPKGNGYYTICERPLAWVVFQFGFLQLWILLILIGTFMRGPNWSFFGPYEVRDVHKVMALSNVTLSEYFWTTWLGLDPPEPSAGLGGLARLSTIVWREVAGLILLGIYYLAVPAILARAWLKQLYQQMGFWRYSVMIFLLLTMLLLPLKMLCRWAFDLSYFVHMPEYFLNF